MQHPRFTFSKKEKLTGKIRIDELYKKGKSFVAFPFFIIMHPCTQNKENRILISVPKRKFKNATDRNLLKRRTREAYRKQKHKIEASGYNIALNYIAKTKLSYELIEQKLLKAIIKINQQIQDNDTAVD